MGRKTAATAAVVVMIASLVVAGPALGTAPPDIDAATWAAQMRQRVYGARAPGSVLSSSSQSMTTIQRIAGVRRSTALSQAGQVTIPAATVGTASKFGTVLRGAGQAVTAAFALDLTYTAFTGGFGDGFGFAGLTGFESEGLICDLTALFTGDSGCTVAAGPGYDPNEDGGLFPAGWNADPHWCSADGYSWCVSGSLVTSVVSGGTGSITGTIVASGNGTRPGAYLEAYYDLGGSVESHTRVVSGLQSVSYTGSTGTYALPAAARLRRIIWAGVANHPATWYPVGDPLRPVEPDPERWWTTTWLCEGGSPQTATSARWHESDVEWPTPVEPSCDGSALSSVTVTENTTGLDPYVLYEWEADPTLSAWAATYPQCTDGSCVLELSRIDPQTSTRLACFDNPALCLDWFADPAKTDNYVCTYGGQDVALSECNMYAPTFDPAKRAVGGTFADPATGEEPTGTPLPVPTEDTSCPPPFSWSALFNPWYYYKGATCALAWAFVPSEGTVGRLENFRADVSGRAPVSYMVTGVGWIGAAGDGLSGGGSCADGPFEMGGDDLPSFNLCEAAVSARQTTWGTVLWNMIAAGLVGSGLFLAWRRIAVSFGGKS